MLDVEGYILVGGESSRMGKDKSELRFGGRTSVELIAVALQDVTRSVRTVGSRASSKVSLPNIPDLRENWGPLAGIQAALRYSISDYCIIVACDLPFVTSSLFKRLFRRIEQADAVVPLQSDGRPQPLCGIYRRATCLPAAERGIANREHSPRALLDQVQTLYLPFNELSDIEGSEHFFFNVNTPDNYARAQQIFTSINGRTR